MSRRQRSAREQAQRARVAQQKSLRRRTRTRRAAGAAAAAVTLAGTGTAAESAVPSASSATASSLDCSAYATPDSSPRDLTEVDGALFFTATNARGSALWRTDGTEGGTVRLKGLGSDSGYYDDDYGDTAMAGVDGRLFFTLEDDGVDELWSSDGTKAGTVRVKRFPSTGDDDYYGEGGPDDLTAVGSTLFFTATDPVHGEELWRSDGTAAGTTMVKDIGSDDGDYSYGPTSLTAVGSTLFFTADDGDAGQELWKSDGTPAGTVLVKDVRPGAYDSYPGRLTAVGDTLFFRARDGVHGRELWRSDGTETGTTLVEDIRPGAASSSPSELTAAGGDLFFSATTDATSGRDLWMWDGTADETVLVVDFPAASGPYDDYGLYEIEAVGNAVFFAAADEAHGLELWTSDGTEGGTVMVEDIRAGEYPSYPSSLTAAGGKLYFTARDGVHGRELWSSDGTEGGTSLVEDIGPNGSGNPEQITAVGGEVFFSADDRAHGSELWQSDGTEAGTSLVVDINKGGAFAVSNRAAADADAGTMRVRAEFDSAGTLAVAPAGVGGVRSGEREITGAQETRLTLELTRAATRTLRRTGRVEVGVEFTFSSCGGAVRSRSDTYTLKK